MAVSWIVAAVLGAITLVPVCALAQTPSRVIRTIDQRCANCHQNPGTGRRPDVEGAPALARLRTLPPQRLLEAMTTGSMRAHAEGIPDDVKRQMAEFLGGRKLAGAERADARLMPNRCASRPAPGSPAGASWNGWSPDPANTRFQPGAGLDAAAVPRLALKWAFGLPGARSVYGQPTAANGRVFVGADTGYVYALDAASGCVHWSFQAEDGVRTAPSVGAVAGTPGRTAVYFGDIRGNVYAVNVESGELLWQAAADTHPLAAITGAPTLHEGRLYVPVSSREEAPGSSPYYPCCTFRGSIVALDAATGKQIWKTYTIAEAPRPTRKNSAGTQQWAPAGAAVWHAPTIDAERRAVYVATGDAYTLPAPATTDAVMALDMDTGAVRWSVQDTANDAWLVGCAQEPTENCPDDLGPDFDFGASPMLVRLAGGRRLLLAGQKSGQVFAHDPDRDGRVAWTATLVDKLGAAEILFGGAADERTAYFGLDNGVLAAVDLATGERRWSVTSPAGSRGGLTAALTVIPGAVLAGGRDAMLRAYAADSGRVLWEYNMLQEVKTVNGVPARGGAMGAPGPTAAGGMLFVPSGYTGLGNGTPGNVLLVFAP